MGFLSPANSPASMTRMMMAHASVATWCLSRKARNLLAHMYHGNGGRSGKGKAKGRASIKGGKGRGREQPPTMALGQPAPYMADAPHAVEHDIADVALDVQAIPPQAAQLRAQSTLLQTEWSVPVVAHQFLDRKGGVSIVPKAQIAAVVERVGYTVAATAVVITQDPDAVGFRGYHAHASTVRCRLVALVVSALRHRWSDFSYNLASALRCHRSWWDLVFHWKRLWSPWLSRCRSGMAGLLAHTLAAPWCTSCPSMFLLPLLLMSHHVMALLPPFMCMKQVWTLCCALVAVVACSSKRRGR
eukprot:1304328-Amphidinium_carterae.1